MSMPLPDMFMPNVNKVPAVTTLSNESITSRNSHTTTESLFKNINQTTEAPSPAKNSELVWRSKDRKPYILELDVIIRTEVPNKLSGPSLLWQGLCFYMQPHTGPM